MMLNLWVSKINVGKVSTLTKIVAGEVIKLPSMIIIGEVVKLHEKLTWYS